MNDKSYIRDSHIRACRDAWQRHFDTCEACYGGSFCEYGLNLQDEYQRAIQLKEAICPQTSSE